MRIGMIVRAGNTGLGTLSWEYARHLEPTKTLIVTNGVEQTFPERYSQYNPRHAARPFTLTQEDMEWITDDVDVVISFETFYEWRVIAVARKKNVKTVFLTMAELFPEKVPIMPSLFICPSPLDMDIVPDPKVFLPVPLAIDRLLFKERTQAKVFVHSGSHGGMNDRKGTGLLLNAMKYVKSDIQLKIYSWQPFDTDDLRITINAVNFKNYWQLWREGDVLVYPQGANGICLPIVEAMACGLGVITTDQYPFNEYMPAELLFKPSGFQKMRFGSNLREVDDPLMDPEVLAAKIDEIANTDITKVSREGRLYAEKNSWEVLLPKYKEVLENLCK